MSRIDYKIDTMHEGGDNMVHHDILAYIVRASIKNGENYAFKTSCLLVEVEELSFFMRSKRTISFYGSFFNIKIIFYFN